MSSNKYDSLKLENQICSPLYACSRDVIKQYKPFLDNIDLTYTQYITMMVLWEHESITTKELGKLLYLDSGTLTPLLKKMESKGLLTRKRSREDERNLIVTITDSGRSLKEKAVSIPEQMVQCSNLDSKDAADLYRILNKMLENFGAE